VADRSDKLPKNVAGAFYVDGQCIDCDLCRQVAPANFDRHAEGGYSFVSKQPTSEDELRDTRLALDDCPVAAIGDDGL
jgi:ferredoxin